MALGPCMASKHVLFEMLCNSAFEVLLAFIHFQSLSILPAFTTIMYALFTSKQYTIKSSIIPPSGFVKQLYWALPAVSFEASLVVRR